MTWFLNRTDVDSDWHGHLQSQSELCLFRWDGSMPSTDRVQLNLVLKMNTTQVVTPVIINNNYIQAYTHPNDYF